MHNNKKIELISECDNDLIANYTNYLKSLNLKNNTISSNLILLKKFLNYLTKNNLTIYTFNNESIVNFVDTNSIGLSAAIKSFCNYAIIILMLKNKKLKKVLAVLYTGRRTNAKIK